jgi:hypothetical protein
MTEREKIIDQIEIYKEKIDELKHELDCIDNPEKVRINVGDTFIQMNNDDRTHQSCLIVRIKSMQSEYFSRDDRHVEIEVISIGPVCISCYRTNVCEEDITGYFKKIDKAAFTEAHEIYIKYKQEDKELLNKYKEIIETNVSKYFNI